MNTAENTMLALFTVSFYGWLDMKMQYIECGDWISRCSIQNGTLLSLKERWNISLCNNTDHAQWNKSHWKEQELDDFMHMWDIKQEAINEQIKQRKPQMQTTVQRLLEGKGRRETLKRVKGVNYMEMKETKLWVVNTQWNIQMMYYIIVHLKLTQSY